MSDPLGYKGPLPDRLRRMAEDAVAGRNADAVHREAAVLRAALGRPPRSPWDYLVRYSSGQLSAAKVRKALHLRSQIELVHALIDAGHEVPAEDRILAIQVRLRRMTGWMPWDND